MPNIRGPRTYCVCRRWGTTLYEQFAGELLKNATLAVGLGKSIMLFGRSARQGLEPVRIVVRTMLERPLSHAGSYTVGHFAGQRRSVLDSIDKRLVSLFVQILAHGLAIEDLFAEIIRRAAFGSCDIDGAVIERGIDHFESQQCHVFHYVFNQP